MLGKVEVLDGRLGGALAQIQMRITNEDRQAPECHADPA